MNKVFKKACWISSSSDASPIIFKKEFKTKKEIKKAILKITSMGFYDALVNNKKVTDTIFNPGWTSFNKRVQYQQYDVTNLLDKSNKLEITVGEGWGASRRLGWDSPTRPYFKESLIYEIEISYIDKTKDIIYSNKNDLVYSSFVLSSSIYDGEIQDINKTSEFLGKAIKVDIDTNIIPLEGEVIIEGERIHPISIFTDSKGDKIVDFGQNFTGYVMLNIKGKTGDKVSFVPGEMLDKFGAFYNENYRSAKSFYSFTLNSNISEYKPKFSFMGGRYLKLIDYPNYLTKDNFIGIMVHSNLNRTGYFTSGNEKINQLYHNIIYGQLSNYLDIPTDCPQRDERLGWLGDAQVFCKTGAINYDVSKFFTKWLHDVVLEQHVDGGIEGVAPKIKGLDILVACGWSDAITIIPYEMYQTYGDINILVDTYSAMRKWIRYIERRGNNPYLWEKDNHFGDWLALDNVYGQSVGATNLDLLATAFYAYSTKIVSIVGEILGDDTSYYQSLFDHIKEEYIKTYFKDGLPIGEKAQIGKTKDKTNYTETALVITLHFGLYHENDKDKLLNALVELINEAGGLMTTGFLGTPFILHALSDNGRSDVAYNLLFNEAKPSWLFSVNHGATTIWEHYDGIDEEGNFWSSAMNSFNHYAYGAVYDWIFSNTLGIKRIKPRYEEVIIDPIVDRRMGFVKGGYHNKDIMINVAWYYSGDIINIEIEISNKVKGYYKDENGKLIELSTGKNRFYRRSK